MLNAGATPGSDHPYLAFMGYVNAIIALSNSRRPELAPLSVSARAESGSLMLCIPAPLAAALQLEQESLREVNVVHGSGSRFPMWSRFGSTWTWSSIRPCSALRPILAAPTCPTLGSEVGPSGLPPRPNRSHKKSDPVGPPGVRGGGGEALFRRNPQQHRRHKRRGPPRRSRPCHRR